MERQIEGLRRVGVEVETVLLNRLGAGMGVYARTADAVREAMERFRPDVVHIMYGGVMACVVSRAVVDVPVVLSVCGSDLLGDPTGSLVDRLRADVGVWCSKRALRRVDHVVAKSENLRRAIPGWYDRVRISVIPNGVDLDRFRPMDRGTCRRDLGWSSDEFHAMISAHYPDEPNKRTDLARRAVDVLKSKGVRAALHVMTEVEHGRVPMWLNASDAVLMLSHHEGSPNIVKEALACGRPVVAVDVGDTSDRIRGIDGCFLTEVSADAVAECLLRVRAGRGIVDSRERMTELSIEAVAERLAGVYEGVVRGVRGSLS